MLYELLVLVWALSSAGAQLTTAAGKCCFTNPAHTGVCEVTPQKDETCKSILDYLITPNSVGKSYCGETNIAAVGSRRAAGSRARVQDRQAPSAAGRVVASS